MRWLQPSDPSCPGSPALCPVLLLDKREHKHLCYELQFLLKLKLYLVFTTPAAMLLIPLTAIRVLQLQKEIIFFPPSATVSWGAQSEKSPGGQTSTCNFQR